MEHEYINSIHCTSCRKTYDAKRWQLTKDKRRDQKKAHRLSVRDEARALKNNPCIDCGGKFHFAAMTWDHGSDPDKVNDIANMMHTGCRNKILKEIQKCELVCANCHAVRTWERKQYLGMV